MTSGRFTDLAGQRFGRLRVMERAGSWSESVHWHCVCDCGRCCIVRGGAMRAGYTRSCGCLRSEVASATIGAKLSKKYGRPITVRPRQRGVPPPESLAAAALAELARCWP